MANPYTVVKLSFDARVDQFEINPVMFLVEYNWWCEKHSPGSVFTSPFGTRRTVAVYDYYEPHKMSCVILGATDQDIFKTITWFGIFVKKETKILGLYDGERFMITIEPNHPAKISDFLYRTCYDIRKQKDTTWWLGDTAKNNERVSQTTVNIT